jgi:hypothetical protein
MILVDCGDEISALLFHSSQRVVKTPEVEGLGLVKRVFFQWPAGRHAVSKRILEIVGLHCSTGAVRIADMMVGSGDGSAAPPPPLCVKAVIFALRGLSKEALYEKHADAKAAAAKHRKPATVEQLDLLAVWDDVVKILALERDHEQSTAVHYLASRDWLEYPKDFQADALRATMGFTWFELAGGVQEEVLVRLH